MEKNILRAARRAPIGVIIPALFSDLSSAAMQNIIQELAEMKFVKRIYISLDQSSEEEFQRATKIIQPLKDRGVLLRNDAPAVQSVLERINQAVPLGPLGKGRAVWTALGYALGKSEVSVLAFHDADIVTYDRGFLLRLLYPVVHLRYQFAKGFYVRYSDRLHGRVARLFYFPFVKALRDVIGKSTSWNTWPTSATRSPVSLLPLPPLPMICSSPRIGGSKLASWPKCIVSPGRTAFVRSRSRAVTTTSIKNPAKTQTPD
jgi:glucosyl-3-phosphoglycerate synthase